MDIRFKKSWRSSGILFFPLLLPLWLAAKCMAGEISTATNNPATVTPALQGHQLFLMNCAHCHGADATGDEGPDLHDLSKTDQRLANIITNGIKGEMPKFSAKLSASEVNALIAFLHSLK